jgi:hypothetical protein
MLFGVLYKQQLYFKGKGINALSFLTNPKLNLEKLFVKVERPLFGVFLVEPTIIFINNLLVL